MRPERVEDRGPGEGLALVEERVGALPAERGALENGLAPEAAREHAERLLVLRAQGGAVDDEQLHPELATERLGGGALAGAIRPLEIHDGRRLLPPRDEARQSLLELDGEEERVEVGARLDDAGVEAEIRVDLVGVEEIAGHARIHLHEVRGQRRQVIGSVGDEPDQLVPEERRLGREARARADTRFERGAEQPEDQIDARPAARPAILEAGVRALEIGADLGQEREQERVLVEAVERECSRQRVEAQRDARARARAPARLDLAAHVLEGDEPLGALARGLAGKLAVLLPRRRVEPHEEAHPIRARRGRARGTWHKAPWISSRARRRARRRLSRFMTIQGPLA
ncbi:MAG: hypothetical protein QM820_44535 [Minicystis sp.]